MEVWLPIRSLGAVNAYLVGLRGGGYAVVDPGMHNARSIYTLLKGLRSAGLDPRRELAYVAVTHFHVDHLTAAANLNLALGVDVLVPRGDLESVLYGEGGVEGFISRTLSLFSRHGMPSSEAEGILGYHPALRAREAYEHIAMVAGAVEPGERLPGTGLEALSAPGHTPGHTVYLDRSGGYALLGDAVLPRITPHVTLHDEDTDPLGDYMATLSSLAAALAGLRGFPGHGPALADPAARAREILEHHKSRLAEVEGLLRRLGRATAYDVARLVRWRVRYSSWDEYPPPERFFAMGEALAHLRRLEAEGRARRAEGPGGVAYWTPA